MDDTAYSPNTTRARLALQDLECKIAAAERQVNQSKHDGDQEQHGHHQSQLNLLRDQMQQLQEGLPIISSTEPVEMHGPKQERFKKSAAACMQTVDRYLKAKPWESTGHVHQVLKDELEEYRASKQESLEESVERKPNQASFVHDTVISKATSFMDGGACPL